MHPGVSRVLSNQAFQLLYSSGLPLLAAALAVAVFEAVVHPSRVLLALGGWALAILVLDQRNASMDVAVPAALLAAAGIESFVTRTWPKLVARSQVHDPRCSAGRRSWPWPSPLSPWRCPSSCRAYRTA